MIMTPKTAVSACLPAMLASMAILLFPVRAHGLTNEVVINEFMAVNDTTLSNSWARAYFDWIELYNNTPSPVDLKDWYLSDSAGDLTGWKFPATNIGAYGYLLVYASGSNGVFAGQLHANFKLGNDGEYLALVHPDGATIAYEYAPKYPKQYSDISYGIAWENGEEGQRYLVVPTPGAVNSNAFLTAEVTFSVPHGFYSNSFTVALSNTTSGATIYYTTDATEPTTSSSLYSTPIAITRTTALRARAFKTGYDPSEVNTRTYIFLADIITSGDLSTTITQSPIFGPQMTNSLLAVPTISLVTPATNSEINWTPELRTSVEFIPTDGGEGFQVNGGVARFGNYLLQLAKWQYRLYFRSENGASRLEYPLYNGFEHGFEAVSKFNQIDLHSGSHDMLWGFPMSARWADDSLLDMGNLNPHGRFVHLYINGRYWGLYHLRERWNADTMAQYAGGQTEDYEAVAVPSDSATWQDPVSVSDGDGHAWSNNVVALSTNYHAVKPYLDVSELIDFMMVWFLCGTAEPEYHAAGPVNAGVGFKFQVKDADQMIRGISPMSVNDAGPAGIFGNLTAEGNSDFKVLFEDRIYANLLNDGPLTSNRCRSRLLERCEEAQVAFIAEGARWSGTVYTQPPAPTYWHIEKTNTLNKFNENSPGLLSRLRGAGWYPLDAPEYNQRGGMFTNTFLLTMTGPGGATIYYTLDGSDPRQEVTGNAVGAQYSSAITLNRSTVVKARAKSGSTWSAVNEALFVLDTPSTLRVTEIMYNPRDSAWGMGNSTNFEFIEFQNIGAQTIGLAGVELIGGVRFDFTDGNVPTLDAGEYVMLVSNFAAFTNRYTNWVSMNIAGEFHGKHINPVGSLDNGGENIKLVDGAGRTIQSFDYEDDWYPCTDGEGFSLTILDSAGSTNNWDTKVGWRYSAYVDGSPGQADPALLYAPGSVVISEALTHQDIEPPGDWIELRNTTVSPINIGGWYLSDSEVDLKKFRIPTNTVIPANGYVVFTESANFGTNTLGTNGFALSEWGDAIYLSAGSGGALAQPAYRETVDFEDAERDVTFGRYVKSDGVADFTAMSAPTTNSANTYPKMGPVVISEIMYNPTNGQHEFVELVNISGAAVPLYDPLHSTNTWKVSGVNFKFPTNITIGTSTVLLVQDTITPDAFRASNNVPAGAQIFSYTGTLDSVGEKISLKKPLEPDESGVPYADVDVVKYNNSWPWPSEADGCGYSLSRINLSLYGNDATNWTTNAFGGTPGSAAVAPTKPMFYVTPGAISISTPENVEVSNQTFDVMNVGVGTLVYSITDNSSWMGVTVTTGSLALGAVRAHSITFSTTNLTPGLYTAAITISSTNAANSPATAGLNLQVTVRDKAPPKVDMVSSTNSRQIRVVFDEAVQAGTGANGAEKAANYSLDYGIALTNAVLAGDNRTVTLTTGSAMSEGVTYTLSVVKIADLAPIPNPIVGTLTNIFQYVLNNAAPVANAGTNQTAYVQATVTLNGIGSYDPDSKPFPLRYFWSQTGGSTVTINNDESATATFMPAQAGNYAFQLEVFDGVDTGTDSVSVAVLFANTIPYAESFESYYNGFQMAGTNSWHGDTPSAAIVVTNNYTNTYKGTLPISGSHQLVLRLDGSATNIFKNTETYTNVWFDMMLEGKRREDETPLIPDSDAQFAAYVNSNGQICVWNKSGASNMWTTLTETHIGTNEWFRFMVEANYARVPNGFRVYTNAIAVTNTRVWFDSACTQNYYLSMVGLAGGAGVDDLVVTDYAPTSAFVMWLMQYYSGTNDYGGLAASDTDDDGSTAWEEYVGGTIPTDGNSVFGIARLEKRSATNSRIYWRSVTNRYYSVYKSTNVLKGWLSPPLTSLYWGVVGGTNIFDDANSTNVAVFYKITTIKP